MKDQHVNISTEHGEMNTFITCPEEDGPYPVILFLMDAPGKREELHDMARRIGSSGYYVMLPNMYYRDIADFTSDGSPESREVMFGYMNALSNELVLSDCEQLLKHAAGDADASDGSVGVVGYCMSGPFAFYAAGKYPERIKAAASFHGIRLFTEEADSPHLFAKNITGELYIGCAETDDWAPAEMIESLDAYLAETGINYRIEWYPDTHHGFVFPQRELYHKDASERHWERMLAMFKRQL